MESEYFSFNPGTLTCHAPLATKFAHVLGSAAKIEQYLTIHNQEDLVNINKILSQTLNLQISNIIQRVIAQVIGEHGDGFVTIKGTSDGSLHVYLTGSDETLPIHVLIEANDELIGKVQIEGTSQEAKSKPINKASADNSEVIGLVAGKKLCLVNIVFTVSAAANIYLNSDTHHLTGEMDFGDTNEPMGFVSNNGLFPLKTIAGEGFFIESDTAARIRGYVTYYEE